MLGTSDHLIQSKEFALTDRQSQAVDLISSPATNILFYGGARSTKTFTFVRSILNRALAVPKSRHLIARYRFNHVKASIVYDTFPKVMELCFPDIRYKSNNVDWFAEFRNGSRVWFGGLDDKDRTEKILGNEFATIFLNEVSQISYGSYLTLVTRLAQQCFYERDKEIHELRLKMFCDENPPFKSHWSHKLFIDKIEPEEKLALKDPENYASFRMNPVDNWENLSKNYLEALDNLPKRKRDRYYLGIFGDENENALWTDKILNDNRVDCIPENVHIVRTVVAVDPSGASENPEEHNDDIGIGVISLGSDGIAYVLEDLTLHVGPAEWGKVVASAYDRHEADRVIGEENFGGAMVEHVVRTAKPLISYKSVRASKGKAIRAEPVSALHENGKIKFVGRFDEMEDELTSFTTTGYTGSKSPNRADWFVWGIYELFPGLTKPKKKNRDEIYRNVPKIKRFGHTGRVR